MTLASTLPLTVPAAPGAISFVPATTALILIDMQRDFLEEDGFGAALGNDVSVLRSCVAPCVALLAAMRAAGMTIIHTREGHRSDLQDVHPEKLARCPPGRKIGDKGPMGRILIRGEAGHDFIPELLPAAGEVIIDKPGKGAFYSTDLDLVLRRQGITTLVICGVTTEVCVHSTVREANDRGYRIIVPGDCCGSYFPEFHAAALQMISAQGGIFGYVSNASALISVLQHTVA